MIACDKARTRYNGDLEEILTDLSYVIGEVYARLRKKEGYDQYKADLTMFNTLCIGIYGGQKLMEIEDKV